MFIVRPIPKYMLQVPIYQIEMFHILYQLNHCYQYMMILIFNKTISKIYLIEQQLVLIPYYL